MFKLTINIHTYFTPFSSVSTVDLKHVNVSWVSVSIETDGLEAQHALIFMFFLSQIRYLQICKLPIIYLHKLKLC